MHSASAAIISHTFFISFDQAGDNINKRNKTTNGQQLRPVVALHAGPPTSFTGNLVPRPATRGIVRAQDSHRTHRHTGRDGRYLHHQQGQVRRYLRLESTAIRRLSTYQCIPTCWPSTLWVGAFIDRLLCYARRQSRMLYARWSIQRKIASWTKCPPVTASIRCDFGRWAGGSGGCGISFHEGFAGIQGGRLRVFDTLCATEDACTARSE
jgi:hypothetical protein